MKHILYRLKFILTLPEKPLFNIISFSITIIGTTIITYSSIYILSIHELKILKMIYWIILILFSIESILRIFSPHSFFRSYWIIDILSILPSWSIFLFFNEQFYDFPGSLLFRGMIFLRLIPIIHIISEEKSFHLKEQMPSFFSKMISWISISSFLFILLGSLFTSFLYQKYIQKEKENRIHQVKSLIKFYPLQELPKKIPKWILKIENNQEGKYYEIYFINKSFLQNHLIPNIHFQYIEGKAPSEGILVSFIDLYKNKNYLELVFLFTSFFMTGFLYFILRYFYHTYIFLPIEKAYNVALLRLKGEEITNTDLDSLHIGKNNNEIISLIRKVDELYNELRAPDPDYIKSTLKET